MNNYLVTSKVKNGEAIFDKADVLSVSGSVGIVNQIQFQGRSFAGVSVLPYRVVDTNDIVYTKSPLKANPYGILKCNTGVPGIVSTLYAVYKPKNNVNPKFVEYYFASDNRLNQYLKPLISKGAKNDMKVTDDNALLGMVVFPNSVQEQATISDFFTSLDNTIVLHQRKLDTLKAYKKVMLSKMFPKNGASIPEIRFDNFVDVWEQRKLSDILTERNEQCPKSDLFPLVSFTVEKGVTPKTDRYEREQLVRGPKQTKKYKVTKLDDIVYNPANLKFGAIARNRYGNAVFSPIYITFEVDINVCTAAYIELYVTRVDFIKQSLRFQQGTVYERQSVSPENLLSFVVPIPSLEEQMKIDKFFKPLEDTITLHQTFIDNALNFKSSMLSKMFSE